MSNSLKTIYPHHQKTEESLKASQKSPLFHLELISVVSGGLAKVAHNSCITLKESFLKAVWLSSLPDWCYISENPTNLILAVHVTVPGPEFLISGVQKVLKIREWDGAKLQELFCEHGENRSDNVIFSLMRFVSTALLAIS